MRDLSASFGVTRWTMEKWIKRQPHGYERLIEARKAGAAAMAEDGLRIADAATHDNDRAAKLQIDQRRWLASKFDPETFGDRQETGISISINDLHLTAVRQVEQEKRLDGQLTLTVARPQLSQGEDEAKSATPAIELSPTQSERYARS